MARRINSRNLSIQLTPDQYAALEADAKAAGISIATHVRVILAEKVTGFKVDIAKRVDRSE